MSSRHGIYYQCLSDKTIEIKRKGPTLNHNILLHLLVSFAPATDFVVKSITSMSEHLEVLTSQHSLHQLALGAEDQI